MVTNGLAAWDGKDYYFDANGKMQTGGKAPDGRSIGSDGAISGASTIGNTDSAGTATGPSAEKNKSIGKKKNPNSGFRLEPVFFRKSFEFAYP